MKSAWRWLFLVTLAFTGIGLACGWLAGRWASRPVEPPPEKKEKKLKKNREGIRR